MAPAIELSAAASPRVSILIVAARNAERLRRALQSLARLESSIPRQVIIVLNAAEPAVIDVADECAGAVVVASPISLGLAGGAQLGREAARGELLALLHDDVEVEPGWLEPLVEAVDRHSEAGAVGSRILRPDGSRQGSGAVLWRDGSSWVLDGGDCVLPGLRAVDYCGSSSLLVRAATWDAFGGPDERFFPAYFVDTDLGMSIRGLGQVVLVEPRSLCRHHRGSSTSPRLRDFLMHRNQALFREKWGLELEAFDPTPGPPTAQEMARALARAQERWAAIRSTYRPPAPAAPRRDAAAARESRHRELAAALERDFAEAVAGTLVEPGQNPLGSRKR